MSEPGYRWIIVAAGGLLGCVAFGAMFSLPVFLAPMAAATGWSRTGLSFAMTIAFLTMAFGSVFWGSVSDRYGARGVVIAGSALLALALSLASFSHTLLEFQLTFGLLTGLATSSIFAPMMATVTGWFETHRSLAVSLVSAGMGMAPMSMSPLASWLINHYDWHVAMRIIALIVALLMVPTALLVRRPPALRVASGDVVQRADPRPTTAAVPGMSAATPAMSATTPATLAAAPAMSRTAALRSRQLITLLLANFACCAMHSGPIFHTVSYAITCGIAPLLAVSIYSVEGLAGLGGRVGFGLLGDRFGAQRVLVTGLFLQACIALGYYFAADLATFYGVAALFGFTYAGVMPLYSVLARENFPLHMMGTIIGASAMAGSLGMALGPLLGGWIFDVTSGYGRLYIASFVLGLVATLIAMTFRPFPNDATGSHHHDGRSIGPHSNSRKMALNGAGDSSIGT